MAKSSSDFRFLICYTSPHFIVYVKCPTARVWQVVRSRHRTGGESNPYPVLTFTSVTEARDHVSCLGVAIEERQSWFRRLLPETVANAFFAMFFWRDFEETKGHEASSFSESLLAAHEKDTSLVSDTGHPSSIHLAMSRVASSMKQTEAH